MMKYILFTACLFMLICSCKTQSESLNSFTYLVRRSKFYSEYLNKNESGNWMEFKNDTVIKTLRFKSSRCDIPSVENMNMKIEKDTILFDFGHRFDPDCEREIGSALIMVDLVINKRKYPNYKKLIIKHKYDNNPWFK